VGVPRVPRTQALRIRQLPEARAMFVELYTKALVGSRNLIL
jgi:hypothetical protein